MPKSKEFLSALETAGYDFFTGVPCSLLKGVIREFDAGEARRITRLSGGTTGRSPTSSQPPPQGGQT